VVHDLPPDALRPGLAALLEHEPETYLRRSAGRETFLWLPEEGDAGLPFVTPVIVKRSRRRSFPGWRGRDVRPGGRREHENLRALAADGIPVPRAITWCEERAEILGRPARSVVVMERVEHRETLRDRLERSGEPERRAWSRELARLVARLHGRGWCHRDLYLQHFLVPWPEEPGRRRLVLIDVGRARRDRRLGDRWVVKDLAALLHSAPDEVGERERLRFLAGYLDLRGIADRAARRRLARAVALKSLRMRAHVPRDERGG
jgi:tRNA A-37 threonylcarbamoyl transferase component Bud32